MADVSGFCDQQFAPLRAEFERQLDSGAELGTSLAVTVAGVPVVDLWGGWADAERTKPWEHDTITCVWSTTKTITAIAALTLVDKGELDLFAPVARYWPEFGANGKERVEVRHLLSHVRGVGLGAALSVCRGLRLEGVDGTAGRSSAVVGARLSIGLPLHHVRAPRR